MENIGYAGELLSIGFERLFLQFGMISEAQRGGLKIAEVFGIDHACIVLLEVAHHRLDMAEVGLRAVGKGVVGGHLDVDDGTCGAVDIAERDGSLEVCSVVSEGQRLVATPDAEGRFLTRQGDTVVATCGHRLILPLRAPMVT